MGTINSIRKNVWNTYQTTGYTHDVANDQSSAGGVHLYQVRLHRGAWQTRVKQSNGSHVAYGPTHDVDIADGLDCFERAKRH
jgi:hypothetical protein